MWQEILKAKKLIKKGTCFKVGDGFSVKPWADLWVPSIMGGVPEVSNDVRWEEVRRVANLKDENSNSWNIRLLQQLFEERVVNEILKIDLPNFQCHDKLIWMGNNDGVFTVRSCFQVNYGFKE